MLVSILWAREGETQALRGIGFFHPLIHFGFGIEFRQPAIIAEALAQACVHDNWTGDFLLAVEKAAAAKPATSPKTLPELIEQIRADKKLSTAAHWENSNKVRDGVLVNAPDEMIHYATQWTVSPEELDKKTAEMINTAIYFTAAAQHPPKQASLRLCILYQPYLTLPYNINIS